MARGKRPRRAGAGARKRGAGDEGPSAEALRESIIERVKTIDSRHALLAIDAVVSVHEPPFDAELAVEAFVGVAEMVAGVLLLGEAWRAREGRGEPS